MTCDSFRARFTPASDDPAVLDHLRNCERCLDFAVSADPDVMFRALGGEDLVPPGGVDAFVDGVMQQVRVRGAETTVSARTGSGWTRKLAIAATVAAGLTGAMLVQRIDGPVATAPLPVARASASRASASVTTGLATKPVVETYESSNSQNATIIEMPADSMDGVQIVMIFDENLPADL